MCRMQHASTTYLENLEMDAYPTALADTTSNVETIDIYTQSLFINLGIIDTASRTSITLTRCKTTWAVQQIFFLLSFELETTLLHNCGANFQRQQLLI